MKNIARIFIICCGIIVAIIPATYLVIELIDRSYGFTNKNEC